MNCYFIVSQGEGIYVLEDLSGKALKKIRCRRENNLFTNIDSKKVASIIKILPSEYLLSPFRNGIGNYVYKEENERLLFDITGCLVNYNNEDINDEHIIALSEWEDNN